MPSTSSTTSSGIDSAIVVDFAGIDVARRLRALEQHIDAALGEYGELTAAIVRARHQHGLSAVVGQPVFAAMSQTGVALAEARGHTVRGHRLLEPLARALGLDVAAYGEERKDEGDGVFTGG